MSAVPAGSYLVVCPAASDIDDVREMTRRYNQMPAVPLTHRTARKPPASSPAWN